MEKLQTGQSHPFALACTPCFAQCIASRAHAVNSASEHFIQLCSSYATKQQGNKPAEDQQALAARLAASEAGKVLPPKSGVSCTAQQHYAAQDLVQQMGHGSKHTWRLAAIVTTDECLHREESYSM